MTARLLRADLPGAIDEAIIELQLGGVIGIPTETVYGVCVLPTHDAVERLIEAKQRAAEKGIQLLVDSLEQVRSLAVVTPGAARLAERFWPGGMTIVLARRPDSELTPLLGGGRPTLGLRLPDHEVPRVLARSLGPIAASSANVSGQPDATTAQLVAQSLGDVLALILDDGPVRGGTPSTVVDCSDESVPPRVRREGAISAADIAAALR
jgi:L-threonylcarbamoyladenylate synthase